MAFQDQLSQNVLIETDGTLSIKLLKKEVLLLYALI